LPPRTSRTVRCCSRSGFTKLSPTPKRRTPSRGLNGSIGENRHH
jgi:hypothetical protein